MAYITELAKSLIAHGNINGLFLTGLPDEDGVALLTNYVNLVSCVHQPSPPPPIHSPHEGRDEGGGTRLDQLQYQDLVITIYFSKLCHEPHNLHAVQDVMAYT